MSSIWVFSIHGTVCASASPMTGSQKRDLESQHNGIKARIQSYHNLIEYEEAKEEEILVTMAHPDLTEKHRALLNEPSNKVLHPDIDSDLRTEHVVALLQKEGEIGNTLIDHMMSRYAHKHSNHHYFQSSFWDKLMKEEFSSASNWHRRVRLAEKQLIFIPILFILPGGNHWTLIVVEPQRQQIRMYNSISKFSALNETALKLVKRYLVYLEHRGIEPNLNASSFETIDVSTAPRQTDTSSCGIFVITNMCYLSDGRPLDYQQGHILYARRLLAQEVLSGKCFLRQQPMLFGFQ